MKEQLIEILKRYQQTFKLGSDGEYTTCYAVDEEDFDIVSDEIIQALTSVKSESAEEVLEQSVSNTKGGDRWIKQGEYLYYRQDVIIQAMHDFANNSEAMRENAIGFKKWLKTSCNDLGTDYYSICGNHNKSYNIEQIYAEYLTNKEK